LELESELKDKQIRADLEKQHIEASLQREKLAAEDKKQQAEAALQREKLAAEDKKLQAELTKQQLDAAVQRDKIAAEREKTQADEREQVRQHTERQLRIERGVPATDPFRVDGFRLSSFLKFFPHSSAVCSCSSSQSIIAELGESHCWHALITLWITKSNRNEGYGIFLGSYRNYNFNYNIKKQDKNSPVCLSASYARKELV